MKQVGQYSVLLILYFNLQIVDEIVNIPLCEKSYFIRHLQGKHLLKNYWTHFQLKKVKNIMGA